MIYDQPIMWQLEEMLHFCENHKELYIWGYSHDQKMLEKYLDMCGIHIDGYILSRDRYEKQDRVYTIDQINEKYSDKLKVGVLIAVSDFHFNAIMREIESCGFCANNVYMVSGYNKRTISYKMTPRPKEQMWIEVNLVDHCNLNCQMCDHFAPLAKPNFINQEIFTRDMRRLAELTDGYIGIIKLHGGEPLLNDELIEFIRITRILFPKASIEIFTNGLLLKEWENHKCGNLWKACHDYKVRLELTIYPVNKKIDEIKKLAEKYDVHLDCFSESADRSYEGEKHFMKMPFDLAGNVEKWQFIRCYQFNTCIVLRNGKLYTCPLIPYIDIFNDFFHQNLEVTENDYIDIYEANSYEQLAEFVTRRTDFCRYCKIKDRRAFEWKQSRRTIDEYIDV